MIRKKHLKVLTLLATSIGFSQTAGCGSDDPLTFCRSTPVQTPFVEQGEGSIMVYGAVAPNEATGSLIALDKNGSAKEVVITTSNGAYTDPLRCSSKGFVVFPKIPLGQPIDTELVTQRVEKTPNGEVITHYEPGKGASSLVVFCVDKVVTPAMTERCFESAKCTDRFEATLDPLIVETMSGSAVKLAGAVRLTQTSMQFTFSAADAPPIIFSTANPATGSAQMACQGAGQIILTCEEPECIDFDIAEIYKNNPSIAEKIGGAVASALVTPPKVPAGYRMSVECPLGIANGWEPLCSR